MTCEIVNEIAGIEDLTYLELGTYNNVNFNAIKCREKQSVDTNGSAMFTGTTDESFIAFLETINLYTYEEMSQILRGEHV